MEAADADGLNLKKNLSRIRKVSAALKDPGTSCIPTTHQNRDESGLIDKVVMDNARKGVFLHNWRNQESGNVITRQSSAENVDKDGGSSREEDSCPIHPLKAGDFSLSYNQAMAILRCMDASIVPYDKCEHQSSYPRTQRVEDSDYHYNSEDLSPESEALPLLARPRDKDRAPSKLVKSRRKDSASSFRDRLGNVRNSNTNSDDGDECVMNSSITSAQGLDEGSGSPKSIQSLSHKYRPTSFNDLIGQNIVVQSLMSAIERRRIAPVYLFHGPHGTGKTSAARIFAAAVNCLSTGEADKPCGVCRACDGKRHSVVEVNGSDKSGVNKIKHLVGNLSPTPSRYRVFIVDECRALPPKMWLEFLQLLQKPIPGAVFILTTTHINSVPCVVLSHCRKHLFNRIKNGDIITRLMKILDEERFDVEADALELIASCAEGSLRDAETMLDQLSLLGGKITRALVNDFMGVVPDDKLLELLELAMSSRATETVIRSRELMDSGVDPLVLMSQLVALIIDIIGGTCSSTSSNRSYSFSGGRCLSKKDMDRLKRALVFLSQAEKQLGIPRDRATWFTATLLQLDNAPSHSRAHSFSSSIAAVEDRQRVTDEANLRKQSDGHPPPHAACNENIVIPDDDLSTLHEIWLQCVEKCYPETLQHLLHSHGTLESISETEGGFVAHIAFTDTDIKTRAEGFLSSIISSFEAVLKRGVEVKIALLEDSSGNGKMIEGKNEPDESSSNSDVCLSDQSEPQPSRENSKMNQMQEDENGLNLTSKQDSDHQLSHEIQVQTTNNSVQQQKGEIATKAEHNLFRRPSMCSSSSSIGSHTIHRHRRHESDWGGGGRLSYQTPSARFAKAEVVGGSGRHGCKCSCFRCFDNHKTKEQHSRHRK